MDRDMVKFKQFVVERKSVSEISQLITDVLDNKVFGPWSQEVHSFPYDLTFTFGHVLLQLDCPESKEFCDQVAYLYEYFEETAPACRGTQMRPPLFFTAKFLHVDDVPLFHFELEKQLRQRGMWIEDDDNEYPIN